MQDSILVYSDPKKNPAQCNFFQIFLGFPHYAKLNKNFAKSCNMQIRTKQGPTVVEISL